MLGDLTRKKIVFIFEDDLETLIALVLDAVHKDNDTTKPLSTINVQPKVEQKIALPPSAPARIRNRLADEIRSWADTCLSNDALSPSYFNGLDDAEQIVRDGLEKWLE